DLHMPPFRPSGGVVTEPYMGHGAESQCRMRRIRSRMCCAEMQSRPAALLLLYGDATDYLRLSIRSSTMGQLIDGTWHDVWYDTKATGGAFKRSEASFRNWITADGSAGPSGE